jgi:hypothetical protein
MNQVQTTLRDIRGNMPEPGDVIVFPRHSQLRLSKVIKITPKNSIIVKDGVNPWKQIPDPKGQVSWEHHNKPELHNGEQYIYYMPEFLILNKQQKIYNEKSNFS